MAVHGFFEMQLLVWTLVFMPLLGVYSHFRLKSGKPLPPKKRRYRSIIAFQCLLLLISWGATQESRFQFFEAKGISVWYWLLAVAWLAFVVLRIKTKWPSITVERREKARRTLPENPAEMRYWVPISLLAGITEEWAYRGLACALLTRITGSVALSVSVCAVAFGFAHMFNGWLAVAGTGMLALVFQLVAFQCESLWLVMAIHACYDVLVGVIGMQFLSRVSPPATPEPQPVT